MKKILFLLVIITTFLGCKSKTNKESKTNETSEINVEIKDEYLTIIGKDIWVRSKPSTGDVVMKLNDGDKCKIIEKGEQQTIKDDTDYWYKIEFEGKEGWVFGSQTSVKSDSENVESDDEEKQIAKLLDELALIFKNQQFTKLKSYYYFGDKVFYISNPGAYVVINLTEDVQNLEFYSLTSVAAYDLLFEKLPDFDMDSYSWTKTGCFAEKISGKKYFTSMVDNMKEFGFEPTADEIKFASQLDNTVYYKILVSSDMISFYVAEKDGKWLIAAIDIQDFSA